MPDRVVMLLSNDCVSDPRVEKEAAALGAAGYDVTVLAWDRSGTAPVTEVRDAYRIERLGPIASYGGGVRSIVRFREFWRRAAARAVELGPGVLHCHDLDTAPAGLSVLRALPGAKLVLDHHEFYRLSRMVPQRGLPGFVARLIVDIIDRRAVRAASVVIVANPGNVSYYEQMAPGRVVTVENAPDMQRFRPAVSSGQPRPFTIGYIGQKRYIESLRLLMDIVGRHEDMAGLLAGGGVAEAEVAELAETRDRIEAVGRLRYEEIPAYYERCDVVWALYDARVGNIKTAVPVKALEGMACGLPVLVEAGTWAGAFVTEHRVGLAVDGRDARQVEAALLRLKDDPRTAEEMGRRGRAVIEGGLSWQAASARLVEAYGTVT